MSLYLAFFGFCDYAYNTDHRLENLGFCSEEQKIIKFVLKTTLLTSAVLYRSPLRYFIGFEHLLKIGAAGYALTSAYIPLFRNSPNMTVLLMLLQAFSLAIGPLYSIPFLLVNLRRANSPPETGGLLWSDPTSSFWFVLMFLGKQLHGAVDWSEWQALIAVLILVRMTIYEIREDYNRNDQRTAHHQDAAQIIIRRFVPV